MSTRDEFNTVSAAFAAKAQEFDARSVAFWKEQSVYAEQMIELKRKLILEESLMKLVKKWTLETHNGRVYLTAEEDSLNPTPELQPLLDLMQDGYHSDFELMNGVHLHFSDGDISINFDNPRVDLANFIKEFNIPIDTSKIREEAERLQNTVDGLCKLLSSAAFLGNPSKRDPHYGHGETILDTLTIL